MPDTEKIIAAIERLERSRSTTDNQRLEETRRSIEAICETQRQMNAEIKALSAGFPGGDPESHRRYHESVIEWRETRNRMVKEALAHAAKVGGVAGMGWVCYALWTALKMEITR